MAQLWVIDAVGDVEHANRQGELLRSGLFTDHILVTAPTSGAIHKAYGISNEVSCYSLLHHGGPSIAHLETQYSWAHIRLAATSQGSRPTGMEAPGSG